mgnify:CR=1 FL=1
MEPMERLEKMVELTDQLSDLIEEENLALVERRFLDVEAANKQVIDLFAEAVQQAVPHSGTYSKNGRTGREGTRAAANSLAVALDQNL